VGNAKLEEALKASDKKDHLRANIDHSTVDDSVAPGIGRRIDGLANRDLNVGAIVATAPNLQPVVNLLSLSPQNAGITAQDVRNVLKHLWR
jgi:hypothetical protein